MNKKKALAYHKWPTNNKYSRNYASTKLSWATIRITNQKRNTNDVIFYE